MEFVARQESQRFCSRTCGKRNHNRQYRADGRFAAKVAEYGERRRTQARQHGQAYRQRTKIEATCELCGTTWFADCGARHRGVRYCSRVCQAYGRQGTWPRCEIPASHPSRQPLVSAIPADHPVRRKAVVRFMQGYCVQCGIGFVADRMAFSNHSEVVCSKRCGKALNKARRRARERDAFVEDVHRWQVFERDEWTCRLCGDPLDRTAQAPHPLSPSIDHIVPLARGGTHEMTNVQSAHFLCNAIKRDTLADDAMLSAA